MQVASKRACPCVALHRHGPASSTYATQPPCDRAPCSYLGRGHCGTSLRSPPGRRRFSGGPISYAARKAELPNKPIPAEPTLAPAACPRAQAPLTTHLTAHNPVKPMCFPRHATKPVSPNEAILPPKPGSRFAPAGRRPGCSSPIRPSTIGRLSAPKASPPPPLGRVPVALPARLAETPGHHDSQ
jgi:hypothetical protein